jgi:hypothetical protein
MTFSKSTVFIMAGVFAAGTAAVSAQQNPDSTTAAPAASAATTPASDAEQAAALIAHANEAAAANAKEATTASASASAKVEPSAAARKKAQQYGFHAEIYSGKTMFCRDDATLGTRLVSKKCMGADQFEDYAVQLQIARDLMKQKATCQGGDICGGIL